MNDSKKESEEIALKRKNKVTIKRHGICFLLLCALTMFVISVLSTTVSAATKVSKKVIITMSKPREGNVLPTDAKVKGNASTKVTKVKWKGSTNSGKAKVNVKYTVSITVKMKSGKATKFSKGVIATVNGNKASVKRNSSKKITVTYTFPALKLMVTRLSTNHTKEDLNSRWSDLKPVNKDKNLFIKEPEAFVPPYSTGTVRKEILTDGINSLNFARYVAGLNADVSLSKELNQKAQYGAVLMAHINKMVHKPAKPGDMDEVFYSKGYEATSNSNLAKYSTVIADAKGVTQEFLCWSVRSWLSDQGVSSLGHRIWCLNPIMKGTGFGVAIGPDCTYSDMWVTNTNRYGTGSGTSRWDAIAWPAAGYHPTTFFSSGADWSVRLNRKHFAAKSSEVRVKVTNPSGKMENCKVRINTEPKDPVLIFKPSGKVASGSKFNVEISGITKDGNPAVLKYSVEFFKLGTPTTGNKPDKPDTPSDIELSRDITYEQLLDFIHRSPSQVVVSNDTTEKSLADALQAHLPKDSRYTFTVYFSTKVNATVSEKGTIVARVIFHDSAYNYSSSGETVVYDIPATGASDAAEVEKIEADVKAIRKEFDARIASAKSKEDLKKGDLLNVAKNAVKNGSSVQWLNDPLFSTMSPKNGKNGWVKGTLRVEFGAEHRDIEFYAVLHLDGSITNGGK